MAVALVGTVSTVSPCTPVERAGAMIVASGWRSATLL
jgi:hypothetical protein